MGGITLRAAQEPIVFEWDNSLVMIYGAHDTEQVRQWVERDLCGELR